MPGCIAQPFVRKPARERMQRLREVGEGLGITVSGRGIEVETAPGQRSASGQRSKHAVRISGEP